MSKEYKNRKDSFDSNSESDSAEKVSFEGWFTLKLKTHKKLQAHHYPVILAFFKKNGLTEMETEGSFNSALNKFGY